MIKENDIIQDYTIVHKVERKNNQTYFMTKCNICGHTKIIGNSNIQRQMMNHSARNCKDDYYKMLIGTKINDYKIIDFVVESNKYELLLECTICGHKRILHESELKNTTLCHNGHSCGNYYFKNEIGKTYGDYKILSFSHKENGYAYFNIECIKCHTTGAKSLVSLKKTLFKHGQECFKMLDGEYKDIFEQRFNNMIQRCTNPNNTNYCYYGARGIEVKYDYLVDFYLDYIDEFKEYAKVHGVKNSTFDRIDVNGNYEKGNIRLATQTIQSVNTTKKRYFILEKDDVKVLCDNAMEFGRMFGVNGNSVNNVVRGKSKTAHGWTLVAKSNKLEKLENINVTTKLITT